MNCGSCSAICQTNNTGICLACQRGFVNLPQEDAWVNSKEREKVKLKERKTEIELELNEVTTPRKKRPHARRRTQKNKELHFGPSPGDG